LIIKALKHEIVILIYFPRHLLAPVLISLDMESSGT